MPQTPRERKARRELGARLRALRLARGLTQEQVAARIRTTQNLISRYEREGLTGFQTLSAMAVLYGTTLDYIVMGKEAA